MNNIIEFKFKSRVYYLNLETRGLTTEQYNLFIFIPEDIELPDSNINYEEIYHLLESPSEKFSNFQNFLLNINWEMEDIYLDISYLINDLINDLNDYDQKKEDVLKRIENMF